MITEHKLTIIDVTADKWLLFYNEETNILLCEPFQGSGSYTCAAVLVVADALEECNAFIAQKKITNPFRFVQDNTPKSE